MSTWILRVMRFDDQRIVENKFPTYTDAKFEFDKLKKLPNSKQDKAGGRAKLVTDSGVTLNMAFVI